MSLWDKWKKAASDAAWKGARSPYGLPIPIAYGVTWVEGIQVYAGAQFTWYGDSPIDPGRAMLANKYEVDSDTGAVAVNVKGTAAQSAVIVLCEEATDVLDILKDGVSVIQTGVTTTAHRLAAIGAHTLAPNIIPPTGEAVGYFHGGTGAATAHTRFSRTASLGPAPYTYSTVARVDFCSLAIGGIGMRPVLKFKVQGELAASSSVGADPVDVLVDLWARAGMTSALDVTTYYQAYCDSGGGSGTDQWIVNRSIDSQTSARDLIDSLLLETFSTAVTLEDGSVLIVPRDVGEVTATAIGVDDFVVDGGSDPIAVERKQDTDCFNCIQVKYQVTTDSGTHDVTNEDTTFAVANPSAYGIAGIHRGPSVNCSWVSTAEHALNLSHLLAQEEFTVRRTFKFRLHPRWVLLQVGMILSLTEPILGCSGQACRITSLSEGSDGVIECEAQEWFGQVEYTTPAVDPTDGFGGTLPGIPTDPNEDTLQNEYYQVLQWIRSLEVAGVMTSGDKSAFGALISDRLFKDWLEGVQAATPFVSITIPKGPNNPIVQAAFNVLFENVVGGAIGAWPELYNHLAATAATPPTAATSSTGLGWPSGSWTPDLSTWITTDCNLFEHSLSSKFWAVIVGLDNLRQALRMGVGGETIPTLAGGHTATAYGSSTPKPLASHLARVDVDGGPIPVIPTGTTTARPLADLVAGLAITPEMFGAIGDGTSHPLSERYADLTAAQVVYPHAVALTDEIDWCAWQAAADYLYTVGNANVVSSYNWAHGKVVCSGFYVVNRTITFNLHGVVIEGTLPPMTEEERPGIKGTTLRYNGDDGTLDEPVFIIDSYIYDEFGTAPPGRDPGYPYQGMGNRTIIRGIRFFGKGGSMTGLVGDESGYVSGVKVRKSSFTTIENCMFTGTLWDGFVSTAPQLFLTVRGCWFYNIYRDDIGIRGMNTNFSTTCWIENNEFGYTGRYAIACDMSYSVQPMPIVRNNSFEHISQSASSYFQQNPEWYVHGVVASCVFIKGSNLVWRDNRSENGNSLGRVWGDLHIVGGSMQTVKDSIVKGIILTMQAYSADKVQALIDYRADYGFYDFTDVRAWIPGITGDFVASASVSNLVVENCPTLGDGNIVMGDVVSHLASGNTRSFIRDCGVVRLLRVDYVAGTYANVFPPRLTAVRNLYNSPIMLQASGTTIVDANGANMEIEYDLQSATGRRILRRASEIFSRWAAATAYVTTSNSGDKNQVIPILAQENGFVYQCTVAGTSDAAEPTWPTTLGGTVTDGGVTWTCVASGMGNQNLIPANGLPVDELGGARTVRLSAVPTLHAVGQWNRGDVALATAPAEAGTTPNKYVITGWICTVSGTGAAPVGTWLQMRSLTGN